MFLEEISLVLRPQLYRSNWAPEFSEVTLSPSGSPINFEATKASGGNISDSKEHNLYHLKPFKQSAEIVIE